jgi:hypothetical protein
MIITGAGLVQPSKSYRAVRTGEFNGRTSENPYVIAPIDDAAYEAPLKSAVWQLSQHFFEIFLLRCIISLAVLVYFHHI